MRIAFVMTPYLQIRQKSKESKEIDPFERGDFAEIWRRSHWPNVCQRHRGFDRVSAGCAGDRVDPKRDRR